MRACPSASNLNPIMKIRLDKLLVERKLVPTVEKAQAMIMAGLVAVEGELVSIAGKPVLDSAAVTIQPLPQFVSRGAEKLRGAFQAFQFLIQNCVAMDIGISTGGFTDFLLQHGAGRVFGVDVGYGQLDLKIRRDPRVVLLERTNARNLTKAALVHACRDNQAALADLDQIRLVVMDVSFISVTKILVAITPFVLQNCHFVVLIKPQFEAKREEVGKGGIIRDPALQLQIVDRVRAQLGGAFRVLGQCASPIQGTKGNQEYFIYLVQR